MKDQLLGFLLALMILFLAGGFFYLPATIWLLCLIVFLLLGIFVRLGTKA